MKQLSLSLIIIVVLAVVISPASYAQEDEPVTITISNWDAYMPEDLIDNFTAETGIEVEFETHSTNEEIVGKLLASGGEGFDVVFLTGQFADSMSQIGLIQEIDYDSLENADNFYPQVQDIPYIDYAVPYTWGTTGICYRSDLLDFEPTSWMDLLSPPEELDDQITMLATDRWLLLPAQKALGFSVNTTDEEEIGEVVDLLLEAQDHLLDYDDTTFYVRLIEGEALLVQAWDGWCNYGIAEDENIRFVVPEEGSDIWVDTMVIPVGAEHSEEALMFIDYILRPDIGAWVVENILYKVPNEAVMSQLDEELLATYPSLAMTPDELLENEFLEDIGDAQLMYTDAVIQILANQ